MSSLRRPAAPLDDDDLLAEILLRLPPLPSSLPRASAVCNRWRRLASDPSFRAHHRRRNPPLLGCFVSDIGPIHFETTLEPPDRVPQACFPFPINSGHLLGSRHGLLLIIHDSFTRLLVWDPVTGDQHRVDVPPVFDEKHSVGGAVLRAAAAEGAGHFQIILVGNSDIDHTQAVAIGYSSETGEWADLVSTPLPPKTPTSYRDTSICMNRSSVLIQDSLYWSLTDGLGILAFDLYTQSLSVIHLPVDVSDLIPCDGTVVPVEGGRLGFFVVPGYTAQLWTRGTDRDGAASWVLARSIELDKLLSLNPDNERKRPFILGFAKDNDVVLLWSFVGVFTVQLKSLRFKKLFGRRRLFSCCPFEGVYTADPGVGGEHDGAELPHRTIHNMTCPVLS